MPKLTDEQIAQDWSLTPEDLQFISQFSDKYQLWITIQLCGIRLSGRLLKNVNTIDGRIITHICKSANIPFRGTVQAPQRRATFAQHKKLIYEHLKFKKFDNCQEEFQNWLDLQTGPEIFMLEQLLPSAEAYLQRNKIALPTTYRLNRALRSFCGNAQEKLYQTIYSTLPHSFIKTVDELLTSTENGEDWVDKFKQYPGAASITRLKDYLKRYEKACSIDWEHIKAPNLSKDTVKYLYHLCKYYNVWEIKRFSPAKRYSLMLFFLLESKNILADHVIQMHDQYISNVCRECKNAHERKLIRYKRKNERAVETILTFIDHTLDIPVNQPVQLENIYDNSVAKKELQAARNDINQYSYESRFGYVNLLQNRYPSMRKYFGDFIKLPFMAERGNEGLLEALFLARRLNNKELSTLPMDAPKDFIDRSLSHFLDGKDGIVKRGLWEIGLAIALKDALRSGDVYLESSNRHVSFWNLIYHEKQWEQEAVTAYTYLNIEQSPEEFGAKFLQTFNTVVEASGKNFGKDGFATINAGKLKLKKREKVDIPKEVEHYQTLINSSLPKIKIENLLIEVDRLTGFLKCFTPIHGQNRSVDSLHQPLIATIMAQAMNIGFATMQDCTPNIKADTMRQINDAYIREATIKEANSVLVNNHSQMALSQVHGDGSVSSSDGQRFIINASSLLASFFPRYCGYYEKVISIYTHVSDQLAVYNTNAISCSPRESLHVIDGLLDNNTILRIKEHSTDTEGYTEHIFALCFLLGIRFMPRIKDLKSQQLYRIDKAERSNLDALLTKSISLKIIQEQLDQMVKVVASLKNKLCPAHEIIRRLSKGSPSDQLSKAFTHLGRLVKTMYILQYVTEQELRDKVNLQLNKGEQRHGLARWIFFANQGKFQTGDYEEIMNKASCLSLVSNAVLYWNTVKMSQFIGQLQKNGEEIDSDILRHISLLPFKHVIPMGTYFTSGEYQPTSTSL
ncbi:MAG: Tn3 family transposase [Flavobacteriales bacterium]|nr:Tn3 family transposase [Flavobacteriales bacterium]